MRWTGRQGGGFHRRDGKRRRILSGRDDHSFRGDEEKGIRFSGGHKGQLPEDRADDGQVQPREFRRDQGRERHRLDARKMNRS